MKIIRDKYIDIIEPKELHISDCEKQRKMFLVKKLKEEMDELIDAKCKDILEYGDVLQVMEDLALIQGFSLDDILEAKRLKEEKLGGFKNGIYLIKG